MRIYDLLLLFFGCLFVLMVIAAAADFGALIKFSFYSEGTHTRKKLVTSRFLLAIFISIFVHPKLSLYIIGKHWPVNGISSMA